MKTWIICEDTGGRSLKEYLPIGVAFQIQTGDLINPHGCFVAQTNFSDWLKKNHFKAFDKNYITRYPKTWPDDLSSLPVLYQTL